VAVKFPFDEARLGYQLDLGYLPGSKRWITTRIASAFGLKEAQVRKAVDAALPALLGAPERLQQSPLR
jgi:hypothetical protein